MTTSEPTTDLDRLKESEGRLRAILEATVDAIITIDEVGHVQSFNSAAERIFGYAAEDVIGRNISMLMPPPYHDEHDNYLKNYVRSGQAKIIGIGREVEALRKDGTRFSAYIAVSEVRLPGPRLFTGIVRDISEQKHAEERALQAERLAVIGQTVAGLAHECRTALQRSHASLEMLELDLEGDTEAQEHLQKIKRAQQDLQHLFEEVRYYAAPIHLDQSDCDLRKVWREAWEQLAAENGSRDVQLQDELPGIAVRCHVDRFRMLQVFRNLLENSLAACGDPVKIEIVYSTPTEDESGQENVLQITYRDNGTGLSAEERRRVFEPFFTTKPHGTGLGMSIAERVIQAHGGTIWVSPEASSAGTDAADTIEVEDTRTGAEFLIWLPQNGP